MQLLSRRAKLHLERDNLEAYPHGTGFIGREDAKMSGSRNLMPTSQKATGARPGNVWQDQIPCNGTPRIHSLHDAKIPRP